MSDSNRSSASQAQRATLYTTFSSATPTGIEPVLPERQSGVLTAILWGYVLGYVLWLPFEAMIWRAGSAGKHLWGYVLAGRQHRQIKRPPVWLDKRQSQGSLSNSYWNLFGHPTARSEAPGPKHPLDPVILRHTQISHSASLTVGIIVPWRSNMQYVFLFDLFCSIAFPFRTSCPFFYAHYITCVLVCHSTCGINLSRGLSLCHTNLSRGLFPCHIYYYIRSKPEKSSALLPKNHI